MPSYSFTAAALAAIAPLVAAHGHVSSITAGGTTYALQGPQWKYSTTGDAGWRADNLDDGFVASDSSSLASGAIACHKGANGAKGAQPGTGASISVAAGSSVTLGWNTWPDTHKGPVMNYLAKCPGKCSELSDATGLSFFKISEAGFKSTGGNGGNWATDDLIKAGFKGSVTIPSSLAAGEYVLRHEILALHAAGSTGGAQFYPQCVSIVVTGGGSLSPSGGLASGFYKANDPGVLIDIYSATSYTIPGPAVISGAGGSTGGNTGGNTGGSQTTTRAQTTTTRATTTSRAGTTMTTSARPVTTTAGGSNGGSSSGAVAKYGQCGGSGYTGSTTCVSGSTCVKTNDYYSQCQ